jgi:hypothetical protein
MAVAAPNEAPAVTPRISGAASGFLNNAWNTAPAVEMPAPIKMLKSILGTRMFQKISIISRGAVKRVVSIPRPDKSNPTT